MIDLTAVILTFDEQENLGRTLDALAWVDRVVLIDSFSKDATLKIAQSHPNVCLFQRRFDTHTQQWNYGLEQARTAWVLTLDADYELSLGLIEEIQGLTPPQSLNGYAAKFQFRIFGHPLRATVYPPRTLLFRRDQARYVDDGHTQLLQTKGPVAMLANVVYHDDRKPLSRWLQSQDRYMIIEARHLLNKPATELSRQDRLRVHGQLAPAVMFLYLLFARGLVFDGWPGWYYVLQRTLAEALLTLRVITERQKLEAPASPANPSPERSD